MGVPKFFRYISERYPCLSELITEYQIPEFDNLYLDMNGIIHMCSHPDDYDPHFRITEEKIFSDIFHYIEVLFRMIKPQELFFMAVDGVAPRAKMNQQRGRRFRSAKEAEQLEAKAKERGEELPAEARFDSNCITPGTVFMARLHEQLKYFVTTKISTDRLWQKCKIVLSGHETPGEGEHKIMDYIRYMKAQPDYNPNTRHCLYGLDADLIMLGLCSHEPHFSLLREEVRFGKKAKRKSIPEQINFYLLHLSLMREYLELEFMPLKKSLPFEYDMEKIIDDWVLMGFLVGNDFIPHLPNLHIANGALPVLYNAYMKILPTLEGYINEAGILNLERFEKFMSALAAIDLDNFSEQYADLKYFCSKTGRKPNTKERTSYKRKDLEVWQPDESELSVLDEAPKTTNKDLEALIKSTDDMFADEPFLKTEPDTSTVEINLVSNPDLIVMAKESDFPSIALLPNISDEQKLNTSLELLNISNNIIDKSSLLSSSESTEDTEISPISFKSVLLEESFDKSNNLEDKSADEDCNSVQDTAQSLEQMNLNQTDNSKTEATEKVASVPKYEALLSFLQNRVAEESIDETAVIKPTKKILEPSESNLADLALDIDLHDDEEYEDILSPYYSDSDDDEDDKLMNEEFILHKNDYYMNKLDYSKITPEVMRDQAEGYVRAIQWNLHYYYNGVCSWSWYYPHHYAPYISDIKDFSNLILEYDLGVPFKPFEQLLAVLPAASKVLLPEPYRELMMSEESSIIEYYPQEFRTDLNGKRQEWEAVVLIPFIAEDMLLKAMGPCNEKLTPEEIKRNTHGPMLVYEYTADDLGKYEAPEYYPTINSNHAKLTPVTIEEIRVPIDKLVKGPCPGSIHDVYYPGFPTFRHLKYTGQLEKAKVRVFDAPSQNENMIVCIQNTEKDVNIEELAKNLLGKPVYVSWPHLIEALVVTVSDSTCRYHKTTEEGKFSIEFNKGNLLSFWRAQRESVTEGYKERRGIDVGDSTILIHVKRLVGKKYAYTQAGRVSFEKQWADNESCYPFQAVVKDLAVYEQLLPKYENIQELFPVKSKCFMIGHPYYGSLAEVIDNTTLKSGRVKVTVAVCQEPDLSEVISLANEERYMIGGHAASRLSISSHLLSRLTGAVFVVPGHRTSVPPKNSHKLNVGLNLKLNKKNEEIPGYTKKVDNQWFYSQKSVDLVREYMEFCPELVSYMSKHMGNDVFYEAELFSDEMGEGKIQKIIDWIKKQPFSLIDRQKVGSKTVDTEIVLKIEELVDKWNASQTKKDLVMQVKPHLLYKPEIQTGRLPPDITTVFELYDRVINVREGYTVPFGCKGTVIGIQATVQTGNNGDEIMEAMYDVVFDQAFAGGIQLNCSPNRGYRLPNTALINISHGMRQVQQKTLNPADVPATNNPWYGKPVVNYQPPVQSQNSAFASWNPPMSSNSPNFPGLTHKLPQLRGNSFQQFQQQYGHQQAAKSYQQPQPYHQPPAQSYQQPPKPFQQSPQTYQQQPPNQYQQASYQQQMPIPFPHPLNQRMPIQVHSMNQNHRKPPRLQQQRQQMQKQSPQQKQPQAVQQPMEQSPQKQEGNKTPKLGAEFKAFLQDLQKNQSKANPVPNTGPNIVQTHMKHPVGLGAIQSQQTAQFSQMFNQPSAPPAPVKSGQQGPSDDETEALKKLLNISVTNPTPSPNKQIVSSLDTKQTQQISVQDFFAHARNNDPKLNQSAPSMPVMQPTILQQPPSSPYFSVQLLNYCQAQRIGIPRYSYFTTNKNKIRAQISLQDGRSVYGDECSSKEEATESAAKILLTEGNQIGGSHKKQSNKAQAQPFMPHPNVGPKGFPVPPKQWCQNEKTGQKSFHSSNSSKGGENVKQTTSVKQESEPIVSANLIKQTPNPDENKPGPTPFVPLQADIKKTRTKTLSSSSDGSQSKQCNIKHGTNSSNSTNSHNIKNKPTPEHTTTPQVQPTPITQPKRRVRKSRIAANFSAAPKE